MPALREVAIQAATETTLARVCREAGAMVRRNVKLRDMNLVEAADERSIEMLACGLPLQHGAHLAVDISLLLELHAPTQRPPTAPCCIARRDKDAKYRELLEGGRCHLVVVAVETGGTWSDEAIAFIDGLASARSRAAIPVLRGSAWRDVGDLLRPGVCQFARLVTN